jgi:hypothetical protein
MCFFFFPACFHNISSIDFFQQHFVVFNSNFGKLLVYIWLIFLLPNFSYHKIEKENMNTIESNENCTSIDDLFFNVVIGHLTRCKQWVF